MFVLAKPGPAGIWSVNVTPTSPKSGPLPALLRLFHPEEGLSFRQIRGGMLDLVSTGIGGGIFVEVSQLICNLMKVKNRF
jgi:hypothetical protein